MCMSLSLFDNLLPSSTKHNCAFSYWNKTNTHARELLSSHHQVRVRVIFTSDVVAVDSIIIRCILHSSQCTHPHNSVFLALLSYQMVSELTNEWEYNQNRVIICYFYVCLFVFYFLFVVCPFRLYGIKFICFLIFIYFFNSLIRRLPHDCSVPSSFFPHAVGLQRTVGYFDIYKSLRY